MHFIILVQYIEINDCGSKCCFVVVVVSGLIQCSPGVSAERIHNGKHSATKSVLYYHSKGRTSVPGACNYGFVPLSHVIYYSQ